MTLRTKLGAVTGVLLSLVGAHGWSQMPKVAPVAASTTAESEQKPKASNDASHQGITVHGHWVINVRDAQGNVVQHRDFENALQPTGATALVELLLGSLTPGHLQILVQHTDSDGSTDGAYFFLPASATAEYQTFCGGHPGICSFNLTATPVVSTATPTGNVSPYSYDSGLTLRSSVVAVANISIDQVYTEFVGCQSSGPDSRTPRTAPTTQSPSTCQSTVLSGTLPTDGTYFNNPLTGTSITPLVIVAGQTLDVSVTLSLS